MNNKKPNLDSAAVTARTISRALTKQGFVRARCTSLYYLNEGFTVSRCGYAPTVHVDCHLKDTYNTAKDRERRFAYLRELRAAVIELGYVPREYPPSATYIDCLNP